MINPMIIHCPTAKSNIIPGSVFLTQFLPRIPNPALKMSYQITFWHYCQIYFPKCTLLVIRDCTNLTSILTYVWSLWLIFMGKKCEIIPQKCLIEITCKNLGINCRCKFPLQGWKSSQWGIFIIGVWFHYRAEIKSL